MIVFLDSNTLGAIVNPNPKSNAVKAIKAWAQQMESANHPLIVPAVADYEQRREHTRRNATASLIELDKFVGGVQGRYLPLTDSALKVAAILWAQVRQKGLPTADLKALDCDIVLAAQVLDLQLQAGTFVVVTDNTDHLSRVIACEKWQNVKP